MRERCPGRRLEQRPEENVASGARILRNIILGEGKNKNTGPWTGMQQELGQTEPGARSPILASYRA